MEPQLEEVIDETLKGKTLLHKTLVFEVSKRFNQYNNEHRKNLAREQLEIYLATKEESRPPSVYFILQPLRKPNGEEAYCSENRKHIKRKVYEIIYFIG